MKIKDVDSMLKEFGKGDIKKLTKPQLECLQSACKGVRDALVDNCMSHALYRCTISCTDNIVHLVITGSDANGNMKELQVGYNLETEEVYTLHIELDNQKLIGKEIYNMIIKIIKTIPMEVGMIDMPIEGRFEEGYQTGYRFEENSVLFVIKDSLNNSFFTDF